LFGLLPFGTQRPISEHSLPGGHSLSVTHMAQTPDLQAPEQHSLPPLHICPWLLQLHLPVSLLQFQLLGHPISEHDLHCPPDWHTPKEHWTSDVQPRHLPLMHGKPVALQLASDAQLAQTPEEHNPVEHARSLRQAEQTLLTQ
jgi:hypothetical protein